MRDANGKITVEVAYPIGEGPRRVTLRIGDGESGVGIVNVEFTSEEWVGVLSSSHTTVSAWILPEASRWKIGKKDVNEVVPMPDEVGENMRGLDYKISTYNPDNLGRLPNSVVEWVNGYRFDYHEWYLTRHNYGWALHLRRYDESEV